jgi:hypothetical protein
MGWDSKLTCPPDATHRVTVRATAGQIHNWSQGHRIYLKGTNLATFLAWAGDFAIAFLRAQEILQQQKDERDKEDREGRELAKVYERV